MNFSIAHAGHGWTPYYRPAEERKALSFDSVPERPWECGLRRWIDVVSMPRGECSLCVELTAVPQPGEHLIEFNCAVPVLEQLLRVTHWRLPRIRVSLHVNRIYDPYKIASCVDAWPLKGAFWGQLVHGSEDLLRTLLGPELDRVVALPSDDSDFSGHVESDDLCDIRLDLVWWSKRTRKSLHIADLGVRDDVYGLYDRAWSLLHLSETDKDFSARAYVAWEDGEAPYCGVYALNAFENEVYNPHNRAPRHNAEFARRFLRQAVPGFRAYGLARSEVASAPEPRTVILGGDA